MKVKNTCFALLMVLMMVFSSGCQYGNESKEKERELDVDDDYSKKELSDGIKKETDKEEEPKEKLSQGIGIETDKRKLLEKYGSNLHTLNSPGGMICNGYFVLESSVAAYTYESEFPRASLAYCIDDFDKDNDPELLLIDVNEDYTVACKMYEVENNQVVLSASVDTVSTAASIAEDGYLNCIYYEQMGKTFIGLEERAEFRHLGDGQLIRYTALSYDGKQFIEEGMANLDSTWGTGNDFTSRINDMGISIDFNAVFNGHRNISSYLPEYKSICMSRTTCIINEDTWADDYMAWVSGNGSEKIRAAIIEVE